MEVVPSASPPTSCARLPRAIPGSSSSSGPPPPATLGRGAPEAAIEHLRRALEEPPGSDVRPALLHGLGDAEALVRDPRALADLQAAREESDDPSLRARIAEAAIGFVDASTPLRIAGR